jgi:hypothetical protein
VGGFGSRYSAFDRFQQRHRWLGFPLAVLQKYADDQGGYHAATITYYGFFAIFPLLLVLTTVLGFILQSHPHLEQRIVDSALGQFPVIGPQLSHGSLHGSTPALVLGLAAALWAGMGVFLASQNAMNHLWGVPFKRRPDPYTRAAVHSCCSRCSAAARSRRRSSPRSQRSAPASGSPGRSARSRSQPRSTSASPAAEAPGFKSRQNRRARR